MDDGSRTSGSATERAYRFAKAGILDGTLPAGELISEGQVARPLRLSRTPVREAFLQLQAEGLLKLYPKRGALVVPVSPGEVDAVVEARDVIESHAITTVVAVDDETLEHVAAAMGAAIDDQVAAVAARDELAFVEADRVFHTVLVRAGCRSILLEVYGTLRDRQLRMNMGALGGRFPGRAERLVTEHRRLLDRLRERDRDGAVAALRVHLAGTRASVLGAPPVGA
ncbi:GntR family transcriptional regulator [Pseudonocardia sp. ICBG1293]|uniref:GntR family transcriptional regulator n=1 Tax=Pseudonocardia sp. ICBG1293 TaxID=2844382 RepID=UPI001CCC3CE2|nr:GntR family transcriptional regulator [Pseudonocardia sp. ICBG1293]